MNPDSLEPVNDFWQIDKEKKFTGDSSVKIIPAAKSFNLATENIEVNPELISVNSEIMAMGDGGLSAKLRWIGLKGILREDQVTKSEKDEVHSQPHITIVTYLVVLIAGQYQTA